MCFASLCLLLSGSGCNTSGTDALSGDMGKLISLWNGFGLLASAKQQRKQELEPAANRHAFTLGNDLVVTATIPQNWRYVLHPVYDYTYRKDWMETESDNIWKKHRIDFIGAGVEDGEDNFFIITVSGGKAEFEGEFSLHMTAEEKLSSAESSAFIFSDGTPGTWKYHVWNSRLLHSMGDKRADYYEGIVQDDEGKYNVHLFMLKEEYDANEAAIMDFLKGICFDGTNAGIYEQKGLLERELLTMHIWDEYLNMSLPVPEGAAVVRSDYYNDVGYKVRSYTVYLDRDRHTYFEMISDQGGEAIDRTGDSRYYLNTEDFGETVYELTGYGGGYYFPNWHLWVKHNISDQNVELLEYVKGMMRSFRVE